MISRSALRAALVAILCLSVVAPVAAQNPWKADGGYYEQYDAPAGKFTPHLLRWVLTSHFAPGGVQDFVAFFDCWREGDEGGVGRNKVTTVWTATGLDTFTSMELGTFSRKFKKGEFPGQAHLVNEIAPLAAESAVLIEVELKIKGKIGAGEYVGCDMDLSEHPDGFDGSFEARARR